MVPDLPVLQQRVYMQVFADFWALWLVLLIIALAFVFINQYNRMQRMRRGRDVEGAFFRGMSGFMVSIFASWAFGIMLIVSLIIKIFHLK